MPQVVDAVKVPVIAAGGIADARGILAAFALGAAAVQIGTAYLLCPETKISPVYREALKNATDNQTTLTNIFTGRPARRMVNSAIRELGPMSDSVPGLPACCRGFGTASLKTRGGRVGRLHSLVVGPSGALCSRTSRSRTDQAISSRSNRDTQNAVE